MRITGGWTVCLAVWLFGVARIGEATEYYVAPSGSSDSNNGSIGSPFATFGKAIGLANAGDTIFGGWDLQLEQHARNHQGRSDQQSHQSPGVSRRDTDLRFFNTALFKQQP